MGLFDKKQEQQLEVLKHEFTEDEIAYRYPKEDFYAGSLLYVQPGQEAVLIKDGDQDGPYTNGRYALNTRELPGLSKFVNKLYGGEGAFSCYLYFINKSKARESLLGHSPPSYGSRRRNRKRSPHDG